MFGFFKKKNEIIIRDIIWRSDLYKYKALISDVQKNDKSIIVYYFEDTKIELENILKQHQITVSETSAITTKAWLIKASNLLHKNDVDNRKIIFAEHHPSFITETEITNHLLELGIKQVTFFISMEDELMKQFGGDRIIEMMNKLGYKDDEVIEHSMVSSSIQRAQKKIDEQVQFPSNTRNSKDWFKINVMK
jgi:hypothetical protein